MLITYFLQGLTWTPLMTLEGPVYMLLQLEGESSFLLNALFHLFTAFLCLLFNGVHTLFLFFHRSYVLKYYLCT